MGEATREKLRILADAAKYDASCSSSGGKRAARKGGLGNSEGSGICHSYTPDGRCVSLLKILLTNHCVYDCTYCINRVSSPVERAKFSVDEVVELTLEFYRRNYIEGLFLSSGVFKSPDDTMAEMTEVARRLRVLHRFNGYIHLKAVAGCSRDLIERAGLYADRMSANIELASQADLDRLAPAKRHTQIEASMAQIGDKIAEAQEERAKSPRAPRFAPAGQSTQVIVGATPAVDAQILGQASRLYSAHRLKRVYYSAFSPIPGGDPRLPLHSPPLIRENRLYQADWLMRFYGFAHTEITDGNLDLEIDPKLAWALRNRELFPVDVNRAPREALLRVPGFGVRTVERILAMRPVRRIRLEDLGKLHVPMTRTRYFVTAEGGNAHARRISDQNLRALVAPPAVQLSLFGPTATATAAPSAAAAGGAAR